MLSFSSHKFDSKELILRNYRGEPKKFAVAENLYPQTWKVHVSILDKKGFQVKFETPKHGTNMASTPPPPPPPQSLLQAE